MFLTEIAPLKYRGIFGTSNQFGVVNGMLLAWIIGLPELGIGGDAEPNCNPFNSYTFVLGLPLIFGALQFGLKLFKWLNSQAVGMTVVQPFGSEITFVRNPIFGSAAWFFVIILKLIFTAIFEIKVHVKKFLGKKKNSFSKPDFHKLIYL